MADRVSEDALPRARARGRNTRILSDIGASGMADEYGNIRIGTQGLQTATFVAGIRGITTTNAIPVVIDSAGQLGTICSSRRFKKEIKPMDKASEAILGLKPVTFTYKSDNTATPQFGLIAEEVAKVNPDLVVRDKDGEIYTVRYDAVNAMLLNEFLKEHRKVEKLEATIAQQRKDFQAAIAHEREEMQAAVAQLNERVQKVSAQLEVSKPAPRAEAMAKFGLTPRQVSITGKARVFTARRERANT
jgi:hypothetical protein